MATLSFGDYESHALSTAFFLDEPSQEARFEKIYYGFNEEVDELLYDPEHPHELSQLLLGNTNIEESVRQALINDKLAEVGDVLYYVTAAGMLKEVALKNIAIKGLELFTGGKSDADDITFGEFDKAVAAQIGPDLPAGYKRNYFEKQFFNLPPFLSTGFDQFNPGNNAGPLVLTADARYAIERTAREFSERITILEYQSKSDFIASAGLVLGALSIVLQNRFGATLEDAANNSINKLERRKQAGTLVGGEDPERSRKVGTPKPKIDGYDNTFANLVFAAEA